VDGGSSQGWHERVKGDRHARICEGLGVKSPGLLGASVSRRVQVVIALDEEPLPFAYLLPQVVSLPCIFSSPPYFVDEAKHTLSFSPQ
jgi:hypothetical protein